MPWDIRRDGAAVRVGFTAPVGDWDAFRTDLLDYFMPRPLTVYLL
jgi:hypothetical protein